MESGRTSFKILAVSLSIFGTLIAAESVFFVMNHIYPEGAPQEPRVLSARARAFDPGKSVIGRVIPMPSPSPGAISNFPKVDADALENTGKYPAGIYEPGIANVTWLKPNLRYRSLQRKKFSGETIYDVEVTTDPAGRRTTIDWGQGAGRPYLFGLGCSYLFGEGLTDAQTLPSQLSRNLPGFRVYNYGMGGRSPAALLLTLRSRDLAREIPEPRKSGIAFYLYMDGHLARVFGNMSLVSTWGPELPYVHPDESDRIVFDGSFQSGRRWTTWFYQLLWHSQIVKYFHLDLPVPTEARYRYFVRLVQEMQKELERQIHPSKFYWVFHPDSASARELIPYIEEAGIPWLDFSSWDLSLLTQGPSRIPLDGHPSAEANEVFARYLAVELIR